MGHGTLGRGTDGKMPGPDRRDDWTKAPEEVPAVSATNVRVTSEEESRKVAEESREKEWAGRTFLRELFLGNFLLDHIHPFPIGRERAAGVHDVLRRARALPAREGRPGRHRRDRRVSRRRSSTGCGKLGAFGMKIPKEYGGLGFTVSEYTHRHADGRERTTATSARCSRRTSRSACRSR